MREKDYLVCVWSVLVISLPTISCSDGWRPIAPPEEYYVTTPKKCVDCDADYKTSLLANPGEALAETQLKSSLLSPPLAFGHDQDSHDHSQKVDTNLDLEIYKPTEVTFFQGGPAKKFDSTISSYQEVLRKSPTSFYSFKTFFSPQKPSKTIYYGDVELAKPKFTSDVKYYKPYKPSLGTEFKIFKPTSLLNNEVGSYRPTKGGQFGEHCSLYKVSFRQDLYYQYIQYKVHMPELKEFTLCLWMRFHNHSYDHSLFSYAAKNHRQAIYMWVSNLNEPALFNMKVMGQTIFRLNYPIKLYKWYHTCQSWNGLTGEWQVWVNSHRIARGFHNLLVGHKIPGGGVAISGQEQRHYGKGFKEIPHYLKGSGGLEGEITMLQMYKVALTAGKAYNDHSHHHSHYTSSTTEPPELPTEEPSTTTDHPLLENGQLKKHVNVLELAEALKSKGHLDMPEHPPALFFQHPQPYVSHIAPLTVHGNTINFLSLPNHSIFKRNDETSGVESKSEEKSEETNNSQETSETPEKVKFINNISVGQVQVEKIKFSDKKERVKHSVEDTDQSEETATLTSSEESGESVTEIYEEDRNKTSGLRAARRLRRHNTQRININRRKRITTGELAPGRYLIYRPKKRIETGKTIINNDRKDASKRHYLFEDPYLSFGLAGQEVYPTYGGIPSSDLTYDNLHQFGQEYSEDEELTEDDPLLDPEKTPKKEVELAEGEVRRVMELCSGCYMDPFRKVAVISWRSTPKKIFSGTLFLKARSECENF